MNKKVPLTRQVFNELIEAGIIETDIPRKEQIIKASEYIDFLNKSNTVGSHNINLENIELTEQLTDVKNLDIQENKIEIKPKMADPIKVLEFLKLVPSYDGELTELNEFLISITEVGANLKLEEEKTLFIKLLKTKIKGKAFRVVNGRKFSTIDELKVILEENFKTVEVTSYVLNCQNNKIK
jgi:hypothetical protein